MGLYRVLAPLVTLALWVLTGAMLASPKTGSVISTASAEEILILVFSAAMQGLILFMMSLVSFACITGWGLKRP